jgi:hypothetical protein
VVKASLSVTRYSHVDLTNGSSVSDIWSKPVADLETSRSLGTHAYHANILGKFRKNIMCYKASDSRQARAAARAVGVVDPPMVKTVILLR